MVVTVIGEICTDIFVYGNVDRLSPEAPVPVFLPIETKTNKGMAGNVVENVCKISPSSKVVGKHQKNEIKKIRYVDKKTNHMFIRIDENDISEQININISTINLIKNSDIVIVSDYDKGFLSSENLIEIGKNSKISILDSKKKLTQEILNSFTFVKLNESEYKKNSDLVDLHNVIVTLGARGCMYQNEVFESPKPLETIDVSGAGDTFTASFIMEYFMTKEMEKSLEFANYMSSLVVSKRGVVTP